MKKTENARILMISSEMHRLPNSLDLGNLTSEKSFQRDLVCARTKLANLRLKRGLNARLRVEKMELEVTVNAN